MPSADRRRPDTPPPSPRPRPRSSMLFVFHTPRRLLPCYTCSSLSLRHLLTMLLALVDSIVHVDAVFRLWAGHMRGCYLWGPFRAAGSSSLCEIQISRGPACDRLLVYHFRTLADPTLLSAVHGRVCNKPIHAQIEVSRCRGWRRCQTRLRSIDNARARCRNRRLATAPLPTSTPSRWSCCQGGIW